MASLAANVAVGGADPIGKALAGWPALSMLVSVKLLFSMFDHEGVDQRTTVPDDQRTSGTVRPSGRHHPTPSGTVLSERTNAVAPSAIASDDRPADPASGNSGDAAPAHIGEPGNQAALLDTRTVAHLIPAARAARATLAGVGRSLSRDNLADVLRDDGHGVSNARASLLLKILRAEQDVTTIGPASVRPDSEHLGPAEVVA